MSNGAELLRMLEPAVRPVAQPTSGVKPQPDASFENKSFEALLRDAAADNPSDAPGVPSAEPADSQQPPPTPLGPLSDLSAVSNASLRQLIAQAESQAKAG